MADARFPHLPSSWDEREVFMAKELAALSEELTATVERTAPSVVAVHARPRFSSSGVIWRPGIVVTGEHTIQREEEITVTRPDGTDTAATLVGSDAGTDVAVLRVDGAGDAPLSVAGAVPAPGNLVLAIGRSRNSGVNATMGIVSAVSGSWRTWRGGRLDHYIRLDLTLYPGSSGGVAVNVAGEAIGIVTSVLSRVPALAIPTATVDRVIDEILRRGRVTRAYLGVGVQPVELPDHQRGQIVLSLEPEGPAARAGVLVGDILVSLGGMAVPDVDDLQAALESVGIGKGIEAEVLRGGVATRVAVTTGERPQRN
jgi:S1-C subfamily serine protease